MTTCLWFKRDLRVEDHAPLLEAAARGPVLCLYIYEPEVLQAHYTEASHLGFLNESLRELDASLRQLGNRLITRHGEAVEVFRALHRDVRFNWIYAHQETGPWHTFERDKRVATWARESGVEFREFQWNGVIRRLKNRDGWAAQWYKTMAAPVLPAPGAISPPTVEVSSCGFLENPVELGVTPTLKEAHRQRGGRMAALHTLESFLGGRGRHYSRHLSSPVTAGESCSRLSAYLTFGVLSMREVYAATESEVKRLRGDSSAEARGFARSLSSFAGRLRWHCHFIQKLEQQPELEWRNIMPLADGLREGEWSPERFQAWCAGQTGYPLVDATMRALHH
ncbi:MAG: deoxyribodipyrimidine photo-lyase, partial [Candidatus Sumerlaeia bacterium]|nr:deoxyribodipyrimidine photo-lyase [Candidatus Sumerlaeia bacterium]